MKKKNKLSAILIPFWKKEDFKFFTVFEIFHYFLTAFQGNHDCTIWSMP